MAWQPLHVRQGAGEELYEGVPQHLRAPLWHWAIEGFYVRSPFPDQECMQWISNAARLPLRAGLSGAMMLEEIKKHCLRIEDRFLSVIDALLCKFRAPDPSWVDRLDELLLVGNSAWTVAPDRKGQISRVDPTATEAVAQELAPHDAASDELAEAWRQAYAREPNPSDAWDHSIKAVEHILKPVVCPNNAKATLSNVIGDLCSQPQLWKLV